MTRTDIHRPSSSDFDPQAYDCQGVFDTNPEFGTAFGTGPAIQRLVQAGFHFGHGSSTQCGHCGAAIRYAALMVREDVREFIFVGEDCLDGRFQMTRGEFQTLRLSAKLNREQATKAERIAAVVAEHPLMAWLTYPALTNEASNFVADVAERFRATGTLSDNQISTMERVLVQDTTRALAAAEREIVKAAVLASGVTAPSGKVTVVGEVVSLKTQDSMYGTQYKMVVKSPEGWAVWATVPAAISEVAKGQRVQFNATLEVSDRDSLFAFAKRPTKASILA